MVSKMVILYIFVSILTATVIRAQDEEGGGGGGGDGDGEGNGEDGEDEEPPPKEAAGCNGIFLMYTYQSRTKEYPRLKNVTAQPWAFKSTLAIINVGLSVLKNWKVFIGFHNREVLVKATNAVVMDGDELPADVSNGTTLSGYPETDLKTSVETAGDVKKIQTKIKLSGTTFGIKPPGYPMPRTIKLVNDGYKCPAPKRKATKMIVCCVRDLKAKAKNVTTKHYPRQKGDLLISYDVLQAYANNYQVQVKIENKHPLGRLDHWNLTFEWMRGEFIYNMKGAFPRKKDASACIYGAPSMYYKEMDFSKVMSCEKRPTIGDLPPEKEADKEIGSLPFCCKNGNLLPATMNKTKSVSVFQMQVFKVPPDLNRTAMYPPEKWKIVGDLNPQYKCGQVIRVDDAEFPEPTGLQGTTLALASWQIVCNITHPKKGETGCCVSYSAYYNESAIPCNTCACGCGENRCNEKAGAMLLPPEAILVPFANRKEKALSWAKIKHFKVPKTLPCPDNCGVSINWHLTSNYKNGWSVRITLFNWKDINFADWFVAIQLNRTGAGFQKAYSFNGTLLKDLHNTVFLTPVAGMNFLIRETNGTRADRDPKVPGKQQTVITFHKKYKKSAPIADRDVYPTRLYFNGEECALPLHLPKPDNAHRSRDLGILVLVTSLTVWLMFSGPDYLV